MKELFTDDSGNIYTEDDIRNALYEIGADQCETLFIHSDIMFGMPGKDFKRKAYLNLIDEIVEGLGVKNIIVPTFTYSFCNGEDYNVSSGKTFMGAYNEYVRKKEGRYRTSDPLLSLSVPLDMKEYFEKYDGDNSLGVGSGLDAVHHLPDVKFLFLGAEMGDCFTYVHYVEKIMDVPYRFDMGFEGNIIYEDGTVSRRKQYIHTQCAGVKLPAKYDYFEKDMEKKGFLQKKNLGNKYVACLSEEDAYREIKAHIENDINYYLEEPFKPEDIRYEYTYDTSNGRITHC